MISTYGDEGAEGAIKPLGSNPRRNYKGFADSLFEFASTICTDIYPGEGLNALYLAETDKVYNERGLLVEDLNGPVLVEGEPQARPRPVIPTKPARPGGNPGHAALAFWKEDSQHAASVAAGITKLKKEIIIALGKVITADLSTGRGGMAAKSIRMILEYLETKYGTLTETDLKHLRALLGKKFTTPTDFTKEASELKVNISALEAGGDNMSQTQLLEIFEEATNGVMGIPPIIARYKRRVAIVGNRVLQDLIDMIEIELPMTTTNDAKYANSSQQLLSPMDVENFALATTTASQNSEMSTLLLSKVIQRLDTMESNLRAAGRGPGGRIPGRGRGEGRGAGRGGAGRGQTTKQDNRPMLYCFEHGPQRSHAGTDCHHMKNDATYTAEMKNAPAPCTINGYEGKK